MPGLQSYMDSRNVPPAIPPAPTALEMEMLRGQISTLNRVIGAMKERSEEDRRELERLKRETGRLRAEIQTLRAKLGEEE